MRKLLDRLLLWWTFFFGSAIARANIKLKVAARDAVRERAKMRKVIERDIKRKFGYNMGSKYIPGKGFNKALIYGYLIDAWKEDMSTCSLKISKDLIWL